jgi:hypothetical protein
MLKERVRFSAALTSTLVETKKTQETYARTADAFRRVPERIELAAAFG